MRRMTLRPEPRGPALRRRYDRLPENHPLPLLYRLEGEEVTRRVVHQQEVDRRIAIQRGEVAASYFKCLYDSFIDGDRRNDHDILPPTVTDPGVAETSYVFPSGSFQGRIK